MAFNIQEQYEQNCTFLKITYPAFYQKIIDSNTSNLGIHTTEHGINIDINGAMIYPNNVNLTISQQVDQFLQSPTAIYQQPYEHKQQAGMVLHSKLLGKIESFSPYKLNNYPPMDYGRNSNLDIFPIMVMAGIGNGQHIEELIKQKDVKHLIIIDNNYSMLHVSLYCINWEKIILHFNQVGYKINFFIGENPQEVAYSLLNEIFEYVPYKTFYIPFYIHYQTPFYNDVKKHYLDKAILTFYGVGFIDDNLNSLIKTKKNLEHNIPIFTGANQLPQNATLFIVASGPSLDNDIKYIKQHKDNAIIFSCGTALRVLEQNNIVPDFHFEIEREVEIHDILQEHTSKEFREKISLIGLNVLYDKVFTEDFKDSYLYVRDYDAGSLIVPDNIPKLKNTNPTVTNGAVSFANEFIWDKIYLFGVDMGFKNILEHHAKDAFQYIDDKDGHLWEQENSQRKKTREIPSNFNDIDIGTNDIFFWSKQSIENCLSQKKSPIFNCSDGAKIEYTLPFQAKNIVLNSDVSEKELIISRIKTSFINRKTHKGNFTKSYDKQKKIYQDFINKFILIIQNKEFKTYKDIFNILDTSFVLFKNKNDMASALLKGTITSCYAMIYTHTLNTYDIEQRTQFIHNSIHALISFLTQIQKKLDD